MRGETGDQTDQESRSAGPRAAPSVTAMDITIHSSFLPHNDPDAVPRLLPRHPRLRGPQRRRLRGHALDHRRPRRPARHVHRPAPAGRRPRHHRRRAPHHRRDDGQGQLRQRHPGHQRPRRHLRAAAGQRRRGRPGADRPAVRRPRLRLPRPRGQPDPHPASCADALQGIKTVLHPVSDLAAAKAVYTALLGVAAAGRRALLRRLRGRRPAHRAGAGRRTAGA